MSILQSFIAGQEARRQADAAAEINRMQQFLAQNGQAIFAGDQNALGALAGMGAQGLETAMGLRNSQEERAARLAAQEREAVLRGREDQAWKWKVEEYAASKTAAERAAEAQEIEEGTKMALMAETPEQFDQIVTQAGMPEYAGMFDQREMLAARFMTVADILKQGQSDAPESYQALEMRARSGGLQPGTPEYEAFMLSGGKAESGMAVSIGPDGQLEFRQGPGVTGTAVGQNPAVTNTPRDPNKLARNLSDADAAQITANRELAQSAGDLESIANQMEVLTPKLGYTGPGGGIYGAVDDALGVLPGDSGARGAFRSLATEAQLTFTAKTKGAITDREMASFAQAVPSLSQTPEGNKAISQVLRAGAQRVQARAQFLEEYAAANGSLQGAQAAWQKFMQDNPIISQGEAGNLVVRGDGDWRAYITPNLNPADSTSGPGETMAGDIPSGAIDILRQNDTPEYRKFFDDVFGAGAAARILGGN